MVKEKGKIHIGTSGWHYKHWIGTFYPEGTKAAGQLAYYQKYFKTVELNNSFYGIPSPQTFENWKKAVPDDFIFSVKGNRYFTHQKKLNVQKENISEFFHHADKLEEKAGPVLFQLPPSWKTNHQRLAEFLSKLPENHRYTFEFRNTTWYNDKVYGLLRQYNCAFCVYELAGHLSPIEITADFVYVRLHGPGDKYQGSYSDTSLKKWAEQCIQWQKEGKDVYVYFDNDQLGYAAFNARDLAKLVQT
ncbi:MAG: DUF72 domain-containing protein [Anditalea sp.]